MPARAEPVCVVLAAGRSRRFGRDKTLEAIDGTTMVAHVLAACAAYRTIVVASPANARALGDVAYVVNDEPDRGMTHSLRLAHTAIEPDLGIVVVLADMPYLPAGAVAAVAERLARGDDVAYPMRDGRAGHPVGFSPTARALVCELAEGDTLRALRDDPRLRVARLAYRDDGCYRDVDVPRDLAMRRVSRDARS